MSEQSKSGWFGVISRLAMVTGGLLALVLTIAWLSGMFQEKVEPGWSERGVTRHTDEPTDEVHEVVKTYMEDAVGTLKASSRTVVAAKLLATIKSIDVSAGDQVEKGQQLIQLDDQELKSRLEQAKQAHQAAIANREQAQRDFDRISGLAKQNAVSRAEVDQATRNLRVAEAEQLRTKDAIAEAEVMLSYATISAAKSGRIVDRLAEPGDIAKPGEPLLVLYDATSLRLEAPVMEHLAVKLQTGDTLNVYVDALEQEFSATVDEIVPQADAPSRSFLVKASLPRSEQLYEGMFGRLRIPAGDRRHLCLATDAVVRIGQLEFVDVVLPDETIERRLVKTGQGGMPGRQEVLSGVEAGDRVLLHASTLEGANHEQ
ncbi:MAG: efflux RND transporter periplasmic adaptor subunit [Planctomycetales bacterium]|nr:efflux RND transporter periplasmic adaptor subunit [Planctomycetales bacterium]